MSPSEIFKNRFTWILITVIIAVFVLSRVTMKKSGDSKTVIAKDNLTPAGFAWNPPDSNAIPYTSAGDLIRYGKKLIVNTSFYFGPKGTIAALSNGMNCQNCHLEGGTRLYGNNYSAVFSSYPKFRERSGTIENIYKRINDCMERSLNGRSLDTTSREMKAMSAYINWVGQSVPKNIKPTGAGIPDINFLDAAADTAQGHAVYLQKCQSCHGYDGQGLKKSDSTGYAYPPLWGRNSYTTSAGLYRISRFAGFVKNNMPYNITQINQKITTEQAWDLAAFVNSQTRPDKKYPGDWPDISGKPIDYPLGPYSDSFTEKQHKYGPFGPIQIARKRKKPTRHQS
jgi:thiosulfate dehydrogenase